MIARDLPPEIALKEYRLNLEHQYSKTLAFMVVDMAIMQIQMEIANEVLREVFKQ